MCECLLSLGGGLHLEQSVLEVVMVTHRVWEGGRALQGWGILPVLVRRWGGSWGSPGDCRAVSPAVAGRLLQLQVQIASRRHAAGASGTQSVPSLAAVPHTLRAVSPSGMQMGKLHLHWGASPLVRPPIFPAHPAPPAPAVRVPAEGGDVTRPLARGTGIGDIA